MKRVLFETARDAIGQANNNTRELKAFRILVPDPATQDTFEARCAEVRGIIAQQNRAEAIAKSTFRSLLTTLFSTAA